MKHFALRTLLVMAVAMTLIACGKSDRFTVEVRTGSDIQRMIMIKYAGQRGIEERTSPLEGGKATIEGQCPTVTLLSIGLSDGTTIGQALVANGDKVSVSFKLDPEGTGRVTDVSIKGGVDTRLLQKFMVDNDSLIHSGFSTALNERVAAFVREHPESPVSTLVLMHYFDARDRHSGADSLLTRIAPAARPVTLLQNYGAITATQLDTQVGQRIYAFNLFTATDSIRIVRPGEKRQTLLAFLPEGKRRKALTDSLRNLWADHDRLRIVVYEVSLLGDSLAWRRSIARDSAGWYQAWVPGNVSNTAIRRIAVPRQPFYVLMDSAGRQIYRGSSFTGMRSEAEYNLLPRTRAD